MHTSTMAPNHTAHLHTCPHCGSADVNVERNHDFTPPILHTECKRCGRQTTDGRVTVQPRDLRR